MKTIVIYNGFNEIHSMHTLEHSHTNDSKATGRGFQLPSWDALGIFASGLCLVHCAVLPLIVLALPALAPKLIHDDRTHLLLAAFVTAFCLMAIVPGYVRHSNKRVLASMILGLGLVLFATLGCSMLVGEAWEVPLITLGNLIVVSTHVYNRRLLACCH